MQRLRHVRRNENFLMPASWRDELSSNGVSSKLVSLVDDDASTSCAACHDVSRVCILFMSAESWESQRMSLIHKDNGLVTCRLM